MLKQQMLPIALKNVNLMSISYNILFLFLKLIQKWHNNIFRFLVLTTLENLRGKKSGFSEPQWSAAFLKSKGKLGFQIQETGVARYGKFFWRVQKLLKTLLKWFWAKKKNSPQIFLLLDTPKWDFFFAKNHFHCG